MPNSKDNVTAGKPKTGGAVFRAPVGTALPTAADTDLNEAFVCLGYISDEGMSNDASRSTDDIKAWGGDIVMTTQTEKTDTFKLTFIEALNPDVLKTVHGSANVSGTLAAGLTVKVNSEELDEWAWVVDMIMHGSVLKRVVIPSGRVTSVDEVTYDDSNAVGYASAITAYPDSDGNTHYEYFKKSST